MNTQDALSDSEWLDMVVTENYKRIKMAAYYRAKSHGVPDPLHWAEDVTQEVFLRLNDRMKENAALRSHDNITAWLFTVLKNVIGNVWQKRSNQEIAVADIWAQSQQPSYELLPDEPFPPGLTEEEQDILKFHILQGFTHKEIADFLGISPAACRMRFHRAVEKFKIFRKNFEAATQSDSNRQEESGILQEGGAQNV